MSTRRIECTSQITGVVVYARDAVVTRRLKWPEELPAGEEVELVVAGITPIARPGSFQTRVTGERVIAGLRTIRSDRRRR